MSTNQVSLFDIEEPDISALVRARRALAESPSDDRLQVRDKERQFARLLQGDDYTRLRDLGDWWVAPFFVRHDDVDWNSGLWQEGRAQRVVR